jgi:hypothetical protein
MDDIKALSILRKKLRERMNDLADTVAGGGAKDFGDYRNLCGQIHGLAVAEREILDLQSAMEQSDNE